MLKRFLDHIAEASIEAYGWYAFVVIVLTLIGALQVAKSLVGIFVQ